MASSGKGIRAAAGGSFLIAELAPAEVATPEDFGDEQRQIASMAAQFAAEKVLPAAAAIEAKDYALLRRLLREAGELGLMAVDVPEQYGGLEMDKTTSALIAEHLSVLGSFSVSFSAHTGIGTLPVVWYGSAQQKEKYLPRLASGEWIAAYALSEASSGSDAMSVRTRAVLSEDGSHYLLNGEKMWISNAGFADLFTVFAKVDGEKFSAFLIERGTPGFRVGAEEHKLGIRGSSTCPLELSDCRVPAGNLLGEVGRGHHIAFNILNIGRFKLGAAAVGAARKALADGIRYARERRAFGRPIAEFGLIQQKIADAGMRIFVAESMAYRTVGMIDAALAELAGEAARSPAEIQKRIEEYAVECSILKVWGSEMLDTVVDHVLQIHGGYGYVEEFPAERAYRDARINRIFEGTNEINRLIITGRLMKSAAAGRLPLAEAVAALTAELMEMLPPGEDGEGEFLGREAAILASLRKGALLASGVAMERHGGGLEAQQEIMGELADLVMHVYSLESALLRARKMKAAGLEGAEAAGQMAALYADEAANRAGEAARRVLAACVEGDLLRTRLAMLRRLARSTPADGVALGRAIAARLTAAGRYAL